MQPEPRRPDSGRRRRRRWAAGLGVCAAALGAVYLLLPVLLPRDWIIRRLEADLARTMNRPATISGLQISAAEGVIIEGLKLARREDVGPSHLLTAQRVVLPLAASRWTLPLRLLSVIAGRLDQPLARMEVQGLELWIVADPQGRLNVADLNDRGGARLPALSYDLHQVRVHFVDLREDAELPDQQLDLPRLVCDLDPSTGRVSWTGAGGLQAPHTQTEPRVDLQGALSVPRLLPAVSLGGGVSLGWSDVDLAALPRFLVPWRTGVVRRGLSSGRLSAAVAEAQSMTIELDMQWRDLLLSLGEDAPQDLLQAASLQVSGKWEPGTEIVELAALELDIPGVGAVRMRSDGAPSRYDPFGPTLWQARLDVHVQEPQRALALLQAAAGPLDLEGLARAGSFQLDLSLTCGCPELRGPLHLSVQTSPAVGGTLLRFGLNLPAETRLAAPHVAKPAGRPLQVEAEAVLEDEQLAARNVTLEASYGDARLVTLEPAELRAASGGAGALEAMLRAGLHLGAVQQWLELAPALGRLLEQQGVEDAGGDLELRVALNASLGEPPRLRGCVQVDAGGLDVRSPYFAKPSGDPLELTADYWSEHAAADGGGLLRLHSRLSGGTLLCELRAPRGAPASAHVRLEADRVQDLRAVLPALPAEFEPQIWTQAATVDIETVLAGGGDDWKLRADLTGSRLALSQPVEFLKEPGTTATVVLQGRLQAAPQERRLSVDLTGGRVQVGESRIDIEQGSLELEPWAWPDASAAQPLHLRGGALQGRMALNLAEIGALAAGLGPLQLAGALRGAADVRSVEGAWQVMDAVLELEAAAMTPAARGRFTLDGVVTGAHGQWATPGLDVLLEGSEISLVVEDWRAGQAVQCHVHAPRVDLLALQAWSAGWDSAATRAALNEGRAEVYVRELLFPAIGLGLPGALQEFVGHVAWKDGNLSASGRGACAGGVIDLQLDGWPGAARWSYMLRSVPADAALARWLGQAFPSVIAEGDVSLECHSGARSTAGQFDETFAASGDLTVEGGRLRGKAAPSWVTWVFPQLNLASFEFTRLRDWFEVRSDGTIRHEALFQGRYYHLYATGEQRGRSEVHYELGIDLLAGLEDPYWAQARAGRIPLFDSRTRLAADGSILEETVNYVPLRFAVGLLWRSNPVYTAYHAIRKRAANDK